MDLPTVELDAWLSLEAAVARRYRNTPWRAKHVMRGLLRLSGWRVPSRQESREQVGGLSRSALMRRRQLARAELRTMRTLPPVTSGTALLVAEHRRAFGVAVPDVVWPHERHLSFFHVWGIADRSSAADLVVATIGGAFIIPLSDLEQELERRRDEEAVALMKLE